MKLVKNTVFLLGISLFMNLPINNVFAEDSAEYYEQIYLTEKQALETVLTNLDIEKKEFSLSTEKKKIIQKRLKRKIKENSFNFFIGKKDGKDQKYAIILDEQGKHFPMTFIVSLDNNAVVEQVAVMVYREKKGDAIKRKRFLNQFKNKSSKDSIEVDNDIVHLTGATISSWSMSSGVKKAVVLTEELVLNK
jgi:Na+-translocating ferredoxin:NAD+ oxidoreductase RnfG subunit